MGQRNLLLYGVMSFFLVLFFQNCDGGFHFDPKSGNVTSNSSAGGGVGNAQFKLTTYNSAGAVVPEGQSFEGGLEYRVAVSGSNINTAVISWALSQNTGNCLLRSGTGPSVRFVMCDRSGRVSVQASAVFEDGATSVLVSERTTTELIRDLCGTSNSVRVVFRIPAGTAVNAWNSMMSPVVVYVGQTLRICNDDSVSHQLQTTGSPCAAQATPMAKGQFYDCSIANVTALNATTQVYDGLYNQVVGPSAPFYVRPFNGPVLYADSSRIGSSCATCHGALANSAKRGASFTAIRNAIAANRGGMGAYANNISDDELRAIAFSLNQ